jgi:hypothetical protein
LKDLVVWDVHNVSELFFVDAHIVVHVSLVSNGLESVQMEMQVEITRANWHFLEDF